VKPQPLYQGQSAKHTLRVQALNRLNSNIEQNFSCCSILRYHSNYYYNAAVRYYNTNMYFALGAVFKEWIHEFSTIVEFYNLCNLLRKSCSCEPQSSRISSHDKYH